MSCLNLIRQLFYVDSKNRKNSMAQLNTLSIKELQKKPFSLVLSGGSAFGLSHIGILKYLDEQEIKPQEIIGTSMGAIIAAFYAMGKTAKEIEEIMSSINILSLLRFNLNSGSLLSHKSIQKELRKYYGDITIAMLPMELKIASTDAATGEPVLFDKSSPERLIDILCTTFSIPVIFPPFELESNLYYDGFLSSNLPLDATSEKLILGINVLNKSLLETFSSSSVPSVLKKSFIISIMNQTRLMYQICEKKKFFIVEPNLAGFDFTDFTKVITLTEKGFEAINAKIS